MTMAITKIHPIKSTLNLAIDYIVNGDKTKNEEQDYRHGKRKVFNNGNVILEVVKKGRITGLEIKEALNKR